VDISIEREEKEWMGEEYATYRGSQKKIEKPYCAALFG